jgi:Family of unknown function (DUF6065)
MYKVLRKWFDRPIIEFTCTPDDFGAIAKPVPAGKMLPEWYKNLPQVDQSQLNVENTAVTIKRCLPFIDAMSQGWLLLVPADIHIELAENGTAAKTHSLYPRKLVDSHRGYQVKGSTFENRVILKMETLWSIKTAPGYSCLFVQPLNRSADFVALSGIVDTDKYHLPVNVPMYFTRPDGVFTLEKGTPLMQIIPFKRDTFSATIRAQTFPEMQVREVQSRSVISEGAWYRKSMRAKR